VLNERLNYNATAAAVNAFARENTRKKTPDWPGLERDNWRAGDQKPIEYWAPMSHE
jgi:hypothetical protein